MRSMLAVVLFAIIGLTMVVAAREKSAAPQTPQIGHMVFFKLKDSTPENRTQLVSISKKYLSDHEGTVYFSVGEIAPEFAQEVNDKDWDVALHLVFTDKAAHDKYQVHPRHKEFVSMISGKVSKVRVFDSHIEPTPMKAK